MSARVRRPGKGDAPSTAAEGTFEALQSAYGGLYEPDFRVAVGDATYRADDGAVSALSVDTVATGADRASVRFDGGFDPTTRRASFPELEWADFETGAALSVAVGYGGTLVESFVGSVTEVAADYPTEGAPSVEVAGYGPLQATTRGTATRSWDETTDTDVARSVLDEYDFAGVEVEPTGLTHAKVVQDAESDFEFLTRRARRNGFELGCRLGTARFGPPGYGAEPTVALRYGESLGSFSATATTAAQVAAVTVRYWDPGERAEVVGTAENNGPGTGVETLRVPVASTDEAETVAAAALDRIRGGLVSGRGETVGLPDLHAGDTVRLAGLGDRLDRTYRVERATHRIDEGGFGTSFELAERML